ncbi:MAG TPA: DUF429 domain-containing protein [Dehalococcoidia bacterium]|nr:DUF429 domain-containing protein [Dehalococcoidia bacterium]
MPCREAVYAHGDDILRINRQRTGKGLSVQCLRIIPRIRQVDLFLRSHPEAVGVVSESHPELVFFMLNGGVPLRWNKKSAEGRDERTRIILGTGILTHEELDGMLSHRLVLPRPRPGVDDVLDALVLAVAAQRRSGCMRSLPDEPVCDEMGLPMQMVY